jgi:hypothetical protein
MIRTRTGGEKFLAYMDSGYVKLQKAYAYEMAGCEPQAVRVIQA